MDALEIYLSRLITIRDSVKFIVGLETMPAKLEQKMMQLNIEVIREIERTKRALKAVASATPIPDTDTQERIPGISDFDQGAVTDDSLAPVDKASHKKQAKS